jgi:hypothetical protein
MAAPRRDEPKRDKLACGTGAVMTMDAREMAGKLVPIHKNPVSHGTCLQRSQASHVPLVLNQVLLAGNEFGACVPPLSHKQITHLLRIAVMGIACALAQHARSPAVSDRLPLVATTCRKMWVR